MDIKLPIIPEKKRVVLTFGKCGSTSIRNSIARKYHDSGAHVISTSMYYLHDALDKAGCGKWEMGVVMRHPVDRFLSAYRQLRFFPRKVNDFIEKIQGSEDFHVVPISATLKRFKFDECKLKIIDLNDTATLEEFMDMKVLCMNINAFSNDESITLKDLNKNQIRRIEKYYRDDMKLGGYVSKLK